jgi:polyhydroxyalkanoate synthesis regulator phasin
MNVDNLTQILQTGFRVTLGATSSLVEMLQDAQKRNENLEKVQSELSQLAEEWAAKGEITEHEARRFIESLMNQQSSGFTRPTEPTSPSSVQVTTPQPTTPDSSSVAEIQDLTKDIADLRSDLENLKD